MYKVLNALVLLLFCSLDYVFCYVLVAIAVVALFHSLFTLPVES